jgi:hypothetical protein
LRGFAQGGFEVVAGGEVVDEGSVEDVARAERVGGVDWGNLDLEAAAMV